MPRSLPVLLTALLFAPPAAADPPALKPPPLRLDRHGDALPPFAVARAGTLRLRFDGPGDAFAVSPDGQYLAASDRDGTVSVWAAATGTTLYAVPRQVRQKTLGLAFAPDGTLFVADDWQEDKIQAFATPTGKPRPAFANPDGNAGRLALARDGKWLAAVTGDKNRRGVQVWDAATRQPVRRLTLGHKTVFDIAFVPDCTRLVVVADEGALLSWDFQKDSAASHPLHPFAQPDFPTLAPDGALLAATLPREVAVRDVATGKELHRLPHGGASLAAFAPDHTLATVDAKYHIRLWDLTSRKVVRFFAAGRKLFQVRFTAGGKTLTGLGWNRAHLWDAGTGQERPVGVGPEYGVVAAAVPPDGKTLATAQGHAAAVRLWDAATGQPTHTLTGHQGEVRCLAVAPDGSVLATGATDNTVRVWDLPGGAHRHTLTGHQSHVNAVAFAPDGLTLVSGSSDGTVRVWDRAGKSLRTWKPDLGAVFNLHFAPDGTTLAVVGRSLGAGRLALMDVVTGRPRHVPGAAPNEHQGIAFSPDGRLLAVAGGEFPFGQWDITVFEALTGAPVWSDQGGSFLHPAPVLAVQFSADGRTLVAGHGGELRGRDAATGDERFSLPAHAGQISALALAADGRTLVTGAWDTTALVWDTSELLRVKSPPARPLPDRELHACWLLLAGADAGPAHLALRRLGSAGDHAVAWLKARVAPVPASQEKWVAWRFADLGDKRFNVREKAGAELAELRNDLLPYLRQQLDLPQPLELRLRLEALLAKVADQSPAPEALRALRVVAVLEQVGTPAARALLQSLAAGAPRARLTAEAAAALRRLGS